MTEREALYDDLAGIVDLFGALTRAELERSLDELAFKQGRDADADALAEAVDGAIRDYYLVALDGESANDAADAADDAESEAELLAAGPVAFPSLPPNAEDLPHILDVPDRNVGREAVAAAAADRLRAEASEAVADADGAPDEATRERLRTLLDVTYDVEAWAGEAADVGDVRADLDAALDG
ncbi:DUF7109 family protein [Halopelagius longus]|uniref:Uncharacterized protein n=1 Tax=Halopelagius longus TaxID=1236180 RepID=A0A1H1DAE1_9EURY|nr:hypothetical protein [Halopelagius longus]RDI71221.1 hypothetical protein DWB78_05440 [Halopelagius longus]SDQ72786.1 hypothetical protein SAMN05216278_2284 [Halopelagius longus]